MSDDQEIIKTGVKVAVETTLKPFADLIRTLFGGAAEQIGGMLGDEFAARRTLRRIKLLEKVKAAIGEAQIHPKQIADNIWVPILQEASLQEDETLQEKWANLLTNAADPRQASPVLPSFTPILKEFTFREVRFLDALYKKASENDLRRGFPGSTEFKRQSLADIYTGAGLSSRRLLGLSYGEIEKGGIDLQKERDAFNAALDVLMRNGVLKESVEPDPLDLSDVAADVKRGRPIGLIDTSATTRYYLTDLGSQFIKACQAPRR